MPHSHARRLAWVSASRAAGRRWRSYLAMIGVAAAATVVIAVVPGLPLREGYAGVVLGAIGVMVLISLVGLNNPAMDGRLAEQWSLQGLRRVRGWHVTDNLPFEREDVDHVVVAPCAVLAIETKYHARAYPGARAAAERHHRDLVAADRAAHKVRLLLRAENLRETATVEPVLMVWGPGAPDLPTGYRMDNGVHVVDGEHPELWTHVFNAPRLAPAARRQLHTMFQRFVARRARHDARALPSLRSEMWRELKGGISHERSQRAARRRRTAELRRRHALPRTPAKAAAVSSTATAAAPSDALIA